MSKIKVEFTKVFKKKDDMGNLLGFADVTIDGLTIRGCRYCKGKDGNFLATPSEAYKNKEQMQLKKQKNESSSSSFYF